MGRRNLIQYVLTTYPMSIQPLYDFPTSDIGYTIESDRRTSSNKLDTTQSLPTEYWINITNTFGGYHYNRNVCMYMRRITHRIFNERMNRSGGLPTQYSFNMYRGQVDCWPNIHSVHVVVRWISNIHSPYTRVRRIADPIFIWRIQGSGGSQIEYSLSVCRSQADRWLDIHSPYAGVRRITDRIFIHCLQGSGRSPNEYSFTVCRSQVDHRMNIHSLYAWVRWIADRIFSECM